MTEKIFLGIDLGGESGRVMAGQWDGQRMTLEEVHRFSNGPVIINGTMRWDILRLWSEIQHGLSLAAKRYGSSIVSIGVDTWGIDFVLLSKSGEMLGLPFHYRDDRTRGMIDEAFSHVARAEIFAETGLQFMEINTLYQLLALKKNSPELLEAADCFLTIPDFINWCLTGRKVAEFTNATTTQCFHPIQRQWASGLLQRFGLPSAIFPEVIMPGTKIGPLRDSVARFTGLESVQVVAVAAHDTGSAVVGVPTANTGKANWAYISSGTWSLLGAEVREANLSSRVLELNFTNEGGVDGTYRLLKNIMGLWLVQRCKRAFDARGLELGYADLVKLAESAPALRSFVDPDDPRFLNPPDMPKAIQDFCCETGQPVPRTEGELVRCALESLALKYEIVLGWLEELTGERVEVIHIVGGGSRNALLNQFAANACNRPVLAGPVEATVLGNLMMQLRASGEISSLSELRSVLRNSSEVHKFLPDAQQAEAWRQARIRFRKDSRFQ